MAKKRKITEISIRVT